MAALQGQCPNCGAPIEFGVGSSLTKVCEYCRATVVRGDRGLESFGQVAELVPTQTLVAVGDEGTLEGRHLRVMGRLQLDYGAGPWDEYLVVLDHGAVWAWLAYAEGRFILTEQAAVSVEASFDELRLEQAVPLAGFDYFVAEKRTMRVLSAEGELPFLVRPGSEHRYVDLHGTERRFATLDYEDRTERPEVYMGRFCEETALQVTALGPRSSAKIKTSVMRCPQCGGDVPKLSGDRAERLGCPYCGALSEIATQRLIAKQESALRELSLPIGSQGMLNGIKWTVIAYIERSTTFDGERYAWDEFLLYSERSGFRWLVRDPEAGWLWVDPLDVSDVRRAPGKSEVIYRGHGHRLRNRGQARVDLVLGEVYWKVRVGETTRTEDYVSGGATLSREESPGEVRWSVSKSMTWPALATAFGLDINGPGGNYLGGGEDSRRGCITWAIIIVIAFVVVFVIAGMLASLFESSCPPEDPNCKSSSSGYVGGYRGGGVYFGGK
jgi:hypothetical protein